MFNLLTKISRLLCLLFAFCSFFIFISGCGAKHYTRKDSDIGSIKKIAVLPFENFSHKDYANEKIRRTVIIELLSKGVEVIEPGEVVSVLNTLKIHPRSISITDIQDIGERMGVEALMMGSVETYEMSKGIRVTFPDVSINLMLVEVSSGNIIWSVTHNAGGADFWTRHFGAEGKTLDETAGKVVKEAINTLL